MLPIFRNYLDDYVLAAIGRKQGDQLGVQAERHGVVEKTIRNWLNRFEEEPIEQAPYDAPRPGGQAKVEGEDREQLYFPLKLPELNAIEGCWDQLQEWFKYQLVPDLSTLKNYIPREVKPISEPNIWPYLTGKDST